MVLACIEVLATLINVDDETFVKDEVDDDLERDDEDLVAVEKVAEDRRDEVDEVLTEEDEGLEEDDDDEGDLIEERKEEDGDLVEDEGMNELERGATDDSRLQALREAETAATRSTVDKGREETFLVLDDVFLEVVEAFFVEMGVPFWVVGTFSDEETFLLVEVAFFEEVTVIFFVVESAFTVEVLLIVEVARLTWEEEAGRNI